MSYTKYGNKQTRKKIKNKNSKLENKVNISVLRVFLLSVAVVFIGGVFLLLGALKSIIDDAPSIDDLNLIPVGYASIIYDQDGNEIAKLVGAEANRIYVELDQIPQYMQDAIVALEDERFWDHHGIDIKGMIRAVFANLAAGGKSEGASTITQQLLKNNVLGGAKTYQRKIQEQYLAMEVEKIYSKKQILEYYLNTINLNGVYGVQTAANKYFNKDVQDLTLSECAVIVSITQSPKNMDPIKKPENNKKRQLICLSNMKRLGMITEAEYEEAVNDDVYSRIQETTTDYVSSATAINTYFIDEVIEVLTDQLVEEKDYTETQASELIYRGGLRIYVTQDAAIQATCDAAYADEANFPAKNKDYAVKLSYRLSILYPDGTTKHYSENNIVNYFKDKEKKFDLLFKSEEEAEKYIEEYKATVYNEEAGDKILPGSGASYIVQPQSSFVVIDYHTGHVKAIVGARGEKTANLTLNRATRTYRQPGSCFKVLASFLPGIDTGMMTLSTVYDDVPYTFTSGEPVSNWYTTGYKGLSTIRNAIVQSMNIVAVKAITDVTPQIGFEYLMDLGFTTVVKSYTNSSGKIFTDIVQPLALGGITIGVSNLELTAAYGAIANNGVYLEPIFYTKVLKDDGTLLIEASQESKRVMKETTSFLLTNAMIDVTSPAGTASAARFKSIQTPVAAKTGTTSSAVDNWLIGYTPYYVAGIWAGYDDNVSLTQSFHKALWRVIMEPIHKDLPYLDFTQPASIETALVCSESGLLAVEGLCDCDPRGSCAYTEYFAAGTAPVDYCTTHVSAKVCADSNQAVTDYCPLTSVINKVFIVRPEPVDSSIEIILDAQYELPQILPPCSLHTGVTLPPDPLNPDNPLDTTDPIEGGEQNNPNNQGHNHDDTPLPSPIIH